MKSEQLRNRVTLLLSGLEEGREVRTYLRQFSQSNDGCFAVIKVGGAIVASDAVVLGERLALLQALGLTPIVVYGSGPQLDARWEAAGLSVERHEGLRVTPDEAVSIVANAAADAGLLLADAVAAAGGHASILPPAIIRTESVDEAKLGRVGRALPLEASDFASVFKSGTIPLIGCVGVDGAGRLMNVNADDIARQVALAVSPQKIVFLTGTGGLLDGEGRIINAINLATDYHQLLEAPWVQGGMALKLEQIKSLLDQLPVASSVSLTTPAHLMRELFTHGGAGTLIRRGETIHRTTTLDKPALSALIEASFQRPLVANYWDGRSIDFVLHTSSLNAAAMVSTVEGMQVLDKFAVTPAARGSGLAKAVWRHLQAAAPSLVWRARHDNMINPFYASMADGFVRRSPWLVYWYGCQMGEHLERVVDAIAARPADFEGAADG